MGKCAQTMIYVSVLSLIYLTGFGGGLRGVFVC